MAKRTEAQARMEALEHKWDEFRCHYRYVSHRLVTLLGHLNSNPDNIRGRKRREVTIGGDDLAEAVAVLTDLQDRLGSMFEESKKAKKKPEEDLTSE